MKCLFVSDAHYPKSEALVNFLLNVYEKFDVIYILGDLFEFYYGYNNFLYPHHIKLINALKLISKKTKTVLFEGNHEYNLKTIKRFVDVDIVDSSLDITIDKLKVHMEHGDIIDKKDTAYRVFRAILKNPVTLTLLDKINPFLLLKLSKKASKFSKIRLKNKKNRHTERAFEIFAKKKIKEGFDVVILAHTHKPLIKKIDSGLYINSGDFFKTFSYITYSTDRGFTLKYLVGEKNE